MTISQLAAECAVEIATTYAHARTNPDEVIGEWLDCGEPIRVDFSDIRTGVTRAFQHIDNGVKGWDDLIKAVQKA